MAQSGYTPIQHYYSSTTTNVPLAANLIAGEIAINTADGKLFYKDSSNVVQVIATKASAISSVNNNGVVYVNSSGQATTDTLITWDGTNAGIGTNAPTSKLDVRSGFVTAGTAQSTNGSKILGGYYSSGNITTLGSEYASGGPILGYAVWPSTTTAGAFTSATAIAASRGAYTISGSTHIWYNGASQTVAIGSAVTTSAVMTLDANNNLAIGPNTPNTRLQVYKAATSAFTGTSPGALLLTDSSNTLNYFTSIDFNTTNAPSVPYARIGMSYTSGGSTLSFGTTNSYASGITNTAMTIDSTGNVNIGSTGNYGGLLSVNRAQTSSIADLLTLRDSSSGVTFNLQTYGDPTYGTANRFNYTGAYLSFRNGSTEVARMDYAKTFYAGDSNGSIQLVPGAAAGYYSQIILGNPNIVFDNNSAIRDYVFTKSSTASYATVTAIINNVSDYRLKENIVPLTNALATVAQLKPSQFNFKADIKTKMPYGESTVQGFIAHELAEVMPYAVRNAKDEIDEDGNPLYQGIDTSFLIATLTAAIQEQQALITQLTDRIAALETK